MDNSDQSAPRRSSRSKDRVNYKALQEGQPLLQESKKAVKWSTKELFRLTVIDTKTDDNGIYLVKVHYIGWEVKYDEWRPLTDIVEIPDCYLYSTEGARELFNENLRISIKESLHCQRKTDALIVVRIPIIRDLFDSIKELGVSARNNRFWVKPFSKFDSILGEKWYTRIINQAGDFAYVVKDTAEFWLSEKPPLEEYSVEGHPLYNHRGFLFNFRFVKDKGNKFDYANVITELSI